MAENGVNGGSLTPGQRMIRIEATVDRIDERTRKLENFRYLVVGLMLGSGTIGGVIAKELLG